MEIEWKNVPLGRSLQGMASSEKKYKVQNKPVRKLRLQDRDEDDGDALVAVERSDEIALVSSGNSQIVPNIAKVKMRLQLSNCLMKAKMSCCLNCLDRRGCYLILEDDPVAAGATVVDSGFE